MGIKYALPEIERRWFVGSEALEQVSGLEPSLIVDRFLEGTRLRLRRVESAEGVIFKLGKKYGGEMTNIYLTADEYGVLAALPSTELTKKRYSLEGGYLDVPLDVALRPRWEREFESMDAAREFSPPAFVLEEDS